SRQDLPFQVQDLDRDHSLLPGHQVQQGRRDVGGTSRLLVQPAQQLIALQLGADHVGLQDDAARDLVLNSVARRDQEVEIEDDGDRQKQHEENQEDLDLPLVALQERAPHGPIPRTEAYHFTAASPTNRPRSAAPPRKTP